MQCGRSPILGKGAKPYSLARTSQVRRILRAPDGNPPAGTDLGFTPGDACITLCALLLGKGPCSRTPGHESADPEHQTWTQVDDPPRGSGSWTPDLRPQGATKGS